jgi:hypothetical protein
MLPTQSETVLKTMVQNQPGRCLAAEFSQAKPYREGFVPSAENLTKGSALDPRCGGAEPMRITERYELAKELETRYKKATKKERGEILDAFCLATKYHRKYAIILLRGHRRRKRGGHRISTRTYGEAFARALTLLWEASGYLCSERLQPFISHLLPLLVEHGQLDCDEATMKLLTMASLSTVERTLRPIRRREVCRRMSQTKPGTLLRHEIPIVVGQWKEMDIPGYVEIDLVSHSGEYASGTFLWTLSVVDLSTGWSERVPIMSKSQEVVVAAMGRIREQLPFPLLGIHPDSGGEFINKNLFAWCKEHHIAFSRSRPYHKNDNAHVEQKNWTLVRRLVGYERMDTQAQLEWLDDFYTRLIRPFANCFQPVMKVIGKKTTSSGSTRRIYDVATTPMQRLLATSSPDLIKIQPLLELYTATSPLTLKREIDRSLTTLTVSRKGRQSA